MAPFPRLAVQQRWTPQLGAARVDWSHPLANGLVFAYVAAEGYVNLADTYPATWTLSGCSLEGTRVGTGHASTNAAGTGAQWDGLMDLGTTYTVAGIANVTTASTTALFVLDRDGSSGTAIGAPGSAGRWCQLRFYNGGADFIPFNTAGTAFTATASGGGSVGTHSIVGTLDGTAVTCHQDGGAAVGTNTLTGTAKSGTQAIKIRGNTVGAVACSFAWANRALSAAEVASWHADPFQMLR